MRPKVQKSIFLILFFILLSFPSFGEEMNGDILTLKDALQIAYDNNPQMIVARKSIDAAKGDLITTKTLANPELEFEIGGLKKNEEGERRANLGTVGIKQDFDPPGVYWLKGKIAQNEVTIGEESLKAVWSAVYLDVREVYVKNVLDKKELELTNSNLNSMRQFFSNVQIRFQSGQALKNDLQRAKIELLKAENDYLSAQKELLTAKARLNLALGRFLDNDFDIVEELKEEELNMTFEDIRAIGFKNRPDVKMAELALDVKRKNLIKEHLNRLPSYYAGFKRINEEGRDDYAVLVGVSIPLWNLNQGEVKKAKAERDIQQQRVITTKDQATIEIYEAYLTADLRHKQLDIAKRSLEEADELLRLANLRYSEGKIDFLNYLDQIKAATQSKVNYYQALFNLSRSISELEVFLAQSLRQEDF